MRPYAALPLALVACAGPPDSVLSPGGAASALLLWDQGGPAPARILAVDLTGGARRLELASQDGAVLYALRYPRPLAELGLQAGEQSLSTRGRDPGTPVAPIHRLDLGAGGAAEWEVVESVPAHWPPLLFDGPPRCLRFREGTIELPGTEGRRAAAGVPLAGGAALLTTEAGPFFRVEGDRVVRLEVPAQTPSWAGHYDPARDEVWLANPGGRVVRGHPERGFQEAPAIPTSTTGPLYLSGGPGPGGLELFALSETRELFVLESEWRLLDAQPALDRGRSHLRLAWIGPGAVVASGYGNTRILMYEGGRVRFENLNLDPRVGAPEAISSVHLVPGLGPLVGTRYGALFVREHGQWATLPASGSTGVVLAVAPIPGGALLGGEDGVFLQYVDGRYCDPQLLAPYTVEQLLPLGAGWILRRADPVPGRLVELVTLAPG